MKRIIFLFFLALEFSADLVLEITESAIKPIKIAILEKNSNSFKGQEIINVISKMHNIKKGILMKSLRVAFFGSLSGPDLIQSWELFAESKTDRTRIERCL